MMNQNQRQTKNVLWKFCHRVRVWMNECTWDGFGSKVHNNIASGPWKYLQKAFSVSVYMWLVYLTQRKWNVLSRRQTSHQKKHNSTFASLSVCLCSCVDCQLWPLHCWLWVCESFGCYAANVMLHFILWEKYKQDKRLKIAYVQLSNKHSVSFLLLPSSIFSSQHNPFRL